MSEELQIEFIARGLLVHAGHILLCRNVKHDYLYLPGGHVEFGETAQAAVVREFKEETDLTVTPGNFAHAQEHIFRQRGRLRHEVNVVFHVEHSKFRADATSPPPPVPSVEKKIAFEWVTPAALGDRDFRPAACRDWLARRFSAPGVTGEPWIVSDHG